MRFAIFTSSRLPLDGFAGTFAPDIADEMISSEAAPSSSSPILRGRKTQVFPDVLFSDMPDRNLVSIAVYDRHTKNPLTQENSLCVVAEGAMAKVAEKCFRLIKPLVNGEIVPGLFPELLCAALRVLEWMRHS